MDRLAGVPHDLTTLQEWAAVCHEAFEALTGAGFTEGQAIGLLSGLMQHPTDD